MIISHQGQIEQLRESFRHRISDADLWPARVCVQNCINNYHTSKVPLWRLYSAPKAWNIHVHIFCKMQNDIDIMLHVQILEHTDSEKLNTNILEFWFLLVALFSYFFFIQLEAALQEEREKHSTDLASLEEKLKDNFIMVSNTD